jgi:hypothetical protein
MLFGLHILPETVWTWSFPSGKPIEMQGNLLAPTIIRTPDDAYYYVIEYTTGKDVWYLENYREYRGGSWTKPEHFPLTLGMNNSYEILMLPPDRYSDLYGSIGYIPDTLSVIFVTGQGWFVSDNRTLTRLSDWYAKHRDY